MLNVKKNYVQSEIDFSNSSAKGGDTKKSWYFPFRITPWLPKRVLHIVWALSYIAVGVTMNMAEYGSQRSEQPENVNFESIIIGLKSYIFDWDQV